VLHGRLDQRDERDRDEGEHAVAGHFAARRAHGGHQHEETEHEDERHVEPEVHLAQIARHTQREEQDRRAERRRAFEQAS
jgi:hypothetical protein